MDKVVGAAVADDVDEDEDDGDDAGDDADDDGDGDGDDDNDDDDDNDGDGYGYGDGYGAVADDTDDDADDDGDDGGDGCDCDDDNDGDGDGYRYGAVADDADDDADDDGDGCDCDDDDDDDDNDGDGDGAVADDADDDDDDDDDALGLLLLLPLLLLTMTMVVMAVMTPSPTTMLTMTMTTVSTMVWTRLLGLLSLMMLTRTRMMVMMLAMMPTMMVMVMMTMMVMVMVMVMMMMMVMVVIVMMTMMVMVMVMVTVTVMVMILGVAVTVAMAMAVVMVMAMIVMMMMAMTTALLLLLLLLLLMFLPLLVRIMMLITMPMPQAMQDGSDPSLPAAAMPPIDLLQSAVFRSGLDCACTHLANEAMRQRRLPPTPSCADGADQPQFVCPAPAGKGPQNEARLVTESAVPGRQRVHQVASHFDTWHVQHEGELHRHWQGHVLRVTGDESAGDRPQHGLLARGMLELPSIDSNQAFYEELGRAAPLPPRHANWSSAAATVFRVSELSGEVSQAAAKEMSLEEGFELAASCDVVFLDLAQCCRNDGLAHQQYPEAPYGVYAGRKRKAARAAGLQVAVMIEGRPLDCMPCDSDPPPKPGNLPGCKGHHDRELSSIKNSLRLFTSAFVLRVRGNNGGDFTRFIFSCTSRGCIALFEAEFAPLEDPDLPGVVVLPGLGAAFCAVHSSEAYRVFGGGMLLREPDLKTMAAAAAARVDLAGGTSEEAKAEAVAACAMHLRGLSERSFGKVLHSFLKLMFFCGSSPARIPRLSFWVKLSAAVLKAGQPFRLAEEMASAAGQQGDLGELRNLWSLMGSVTPAEIADYDAPLEPDEEAALDLLRRHNQFKEGEEQPAPGVDAPRQRQHDPSFDEDEEAPGMSIEHGLRVTEVISAAVSLLEGMIKKRDEDAAANDPPGYALLMKALPPAHAGCYCSEEHQPHSSPETTWLMGQHARGLERIMWRSMGELLEVADKAVQAARAMGKTHLQIMAAALDALFALECPAARAAMGGVGVPGAELPPASPGDPFSSGSMIAAAGFGETWGTRVATHDRHFAGTEILERTMLDQGAERWAEKGKDNHLVLGSCTRGDNADFPVTETGGRGVIPILAGTAPDLSARAVVQMNGRLQCVTPPGKPGYCATIVGREALRVEGMSLVRIVAHIATASKEDEKRERSVCVTAFGAAAGTLMAKLFPGRFGGTSGAAAAFANQDPVEIRIGSTGGTATKLTIILTGRIALEEVRGGGQGYTLWLARMHVKASRPQGVTCDAYVSLTSLLLARLVLPPRSYRVDEVLDHKEWREMPANVKASAAAWGTVFEADPKAASAALFGLTEDDIDPSVARTVMAQMALPLKALISDNAALLRKVFPPVGHYVLGRALANAGVAPQGVGDDNAPADMDAATHGMDFSVQLTVARSVRSSLSTLRAALLRTDLGSLFTEDGKTISEASAAAAGRGAWGEVCSLLQRAPSIAGNVKELQRLASKVSGGVRQLLDEMPDEPRSWLPQGGAEGLDLEDGRVVQDVATSYLQAIGSWDAFLRLEGKLFPGGQGEGNQEARAEALGVTEEVLNGMTARETMKKSHGVILVDGSWRKVCEEADRDFEGDVARLLGVGEREWAALTLARKKQEAHSYQTAQGKDREFFRLAAAAAVVGGSEQLFQDLLPDRDGLLRRAYVGASEEDKQYMRTIYMDVRIRLQKLGEGVLATRLDTLCGESWPEDGRGMMDVLHSIAHAVSFGEGSGYDHRVNKLNSSKAHIKSGAPEFGEEHNSALLAAAAQFRKVNGTEASIVYGELRNFVVDGNTPLSQWTANQLKVQYNLLRNIDNARVHWSQNKPLLTALFLCVTRAYSSNVKWSLALHALETDWGFKNLGSSVSIRSAFVKNFKGIDEKLAAWNADGRDAAVLEDVARSSSISLSAPDAVVYLEAIAEEGEDSVEKMTMDDLVRDLLDKSKSNDTAESKWLRITRETRMTKELMRRLPPKPFNVALAAQMNSYSNSNLPGQVVKLVITGAQLEIREQRDGAAPGRAAAAAAPPPAEEQETQLRDSVRLWLDVVFQMVMPRTKELRLSRDDVAGLVSKLVSNADGKRRLDDAIDALSALRTACPPLGEEASEFNARAGAMELLCQLEKLQSQSAGGKDKDINAVRPLVNAAVLKAAFVLAGKKKKKPAKVRRLHKRVYKWMKDNRPAVEDTTEASTEAFHDALWKEFGRGGVGLPSGCDLSWVADWLMRPGNAPALRTATG